MTAPGRGGVANGPGPAPRHRHSTDDPDPGPARAGVRDAGSRGPREPSGWLRLEGVTRHNLRGLDADVPLGVLTAVTGVSGSGKTTLVGHALAGGVSQHLQARAGAEHRPGRAGHATQRDGVTDGGAGRGAPVRIHGAEWLDRIVTVDQRPIGRTPRSNLATYTGLFDAVRKEFAALPAARERGFGPGRFSFNVAGGRCETCQGEGFVAVELVFLPGSYGPCPDCGGARFEPRTLEVAYRGRNIAEVLSLSVDEAAEALADIPSAARSLATLRNVGLGYLRLGQPATELSGGEAQRIKLATELQRVRRGRTLYILDEPTTGLHPDDVRVLMAQLNRLVDGGDTVVVVEHDMDVVAAADWVIDLGPGGGDAGGRVAAAGTSSTVAAAAGSRTAPYLARRLGAGPAGV